MNFTYTYTDRTGARREAVLDAGSRAQVFAILKEKGVTPLSVREGGSVPGAGPGKPASWGRGAAAGGLVVVAAAVAWWMLGRNGPAEPGTRGADAPAVKVAPAKAPATTNAVEAPVSAKTMPAAPAASNVVEVVGPEPPPASNDVAGASVAPSRAKPLFKTGVEQVMGWIFTTELGSMPPPLPNLSKKDLENIVVTIVSKNEVSEEDSEKAALAKNAVELAKKELKQYLKDGGEPQSFLSFYHNELRKAHSEWMDAQRLVLQSLKEEGVEAGLAFAEEVNRRLAEKGIKRVKVPPKYLKTLNAEESGK